MKVILLSDVHEVGKIGEIVNVAAGFARNFLIPKKLATQATDRSVKHLEHQKHLAESRRRKEVSAAESVKRKIETLQITIPAKVGEEDKLYGSITSKNVHDALVANELDIDRRNIVMEEPIKKTGVYEVPVKLGYDVVAMARVQVIAEK
jgi:large subunit ribosomal protein L9